MKAVAIPGRIGSKLFEKIRGILYGFGFFFTIVRSTFSFLRRRRIGYRFLTLQVLFTGVEALSVISLISLALGAVIIIEGISYLPIFGQGDLIYSILIIVITRELGPMLTAFIIIARSATAIATELGNLVVSHEIEAYVSFGINPISYLAVPRFLGVIISMLILNVYFNIFGLVGSYFITQVFTTIQFGEYFHNLLARLRAVDILSSVVKSVVFGSIVSVFATYYGFRVEQSTTEVPQMAIKAVGQSFKYCILADAVITLIYLM